MQCISILLVCSVHLAKLLCHACAYLATVHLISSSFMLRYIIIFILLCYCASPLLQFILVHLLFTLFCACMQCICLQLVLCIIILLLCISSFHRAWCLCVCMHVVLCYGVKRRKLGCRSVRWAGVSWATGCAINGEYVTKNVLATRCVITGIPTKAYHANFFWQVLHQFELN